MGTAARRTARAGTAVSPDTHTRHETPAADPAPASPPREELGVDDVALLLAELRVRRRLREDPPTDQQDKHPRT